MSANWRTSPALPAPPPDMTADISAGIGAGIGVGPDTAAQSTHEPPAYKPAPAKESPLLATSSIPFSTPSEQGQKRQGHKSARYNRGKGHNQGKGRIACAVVPLFPLAARLRCEPDLHHEAVAIFEGSGSMARVIAASRRARRAGVRPGMTLTQARARCAKLMARAQDPECENTAREVLLEIAESFSPRVEEPNLGEEPFGGSSGGSSGLPGGLFGGTFGGLFGGLFGGVVYLDIDGLDRHYRDQPPHETGNGKVATSTTGTKATKNSPQAPQEKRTAEFNLGRALMQKLDSAGLPARVGIASSKLAARVAANLARTVPPPPDEPGAKINQSQAYARIEPKIVEQGQEASFLAPLPLYRLSPHTETADTLERWGIQHIGDFAQLPKAEVRSRLGELGHRLHLIARGIDPRPLIARTPTHNLREGMSLEWPVANLEPFLFVARAAIERLCDRLARRGLGCKRLEMSLQLEPEGFHERSIDLPSPTCEAKTLLTLVRLDLEAHTPNAPILRFQFTAQPDTPRLAQMSLFGPAALSPDRLATTIARLFALLGPGRVGSPRPAAGHLPERFSLVEYTPPPPPKIRRRVEPGRGLLAVRVLRPPVKLEVLTDEPAPPSAPPQSSSAFSDHATFSDHAAFSNQASFSNQAEGLERQTGLFRPSSRSNYRPCQIISEQSQQQESYTTNPAATKNPSPRRPTKRSGSATTYETRRMRIQGKIRIASGPWELEEKWWLENRTERDYWDVELSDGALYRIYRDRKSGQWFADGVYD